MQKTAPQPKDTAEPFYTVMYQTNCASNISR